MKNIIVLLSLFVLITACKKEEPDVVSKVTTLKVNYYKEECSGVVQTTCYLVQRDKLIGTETWQYFHDEIEGFEYQEGFIYLLRVRIEKVSNPPMDASSEKYTLLAVLSKEESSR